MLLKVFSTVFLSALAAGSRDVLAVERSNCIAGETVVFSCSSGKKTISLCASPGRSQEPYVEYRFTHVSANTAFSYRSDMRATDRIFNRATIVGASSASTVIWFMNAGYVYEINDPVKGTPSVSVFKDGKQVGANTCTGNYLGDTETPSAFIRQQTSGDYFEAVHQR